jgi:hypothetical protein
MNGCTTLFTPDGRLINAIGDAPEDTTVAGFIGPRRALVLAKAGFVPVGPAAPADLGGKPGT